MTSTVQVVGYDAGEGARVGVMQDGKIYASNSYRTTDELLADWDAASLRLKADAFTPPLGTRTPVAGARLLSPILAPRNIFFAGANYRDHVEEMIRETGAPLDRNPKANGIKPWHSIKATGSSVVGPDAVVARPQETKMLDWEIELAVIIGRKASNVSEADALNYVAGYTVANDLSARDHVGRNGVPDNSPFKWDWIGQKSFDGSCPMGPAMTPASAIADPQNLDMKLWVNGVLKQDSNTGQMIFSIAEQLSYLSSRITLQPGDVILTGTPSGVGMATRTFLQAGDVVRQWIDGIGSFDITIS